jgi:hypothetical protein
MSAFADYRAVIAANIAIVKKLAETNTAALASAEHRVAAAIEQMNIRFGELNQRVVSGSDGPNSRIVARGAEAAFVRHGL